MKDTNKFRIIFTLILAAVLLFQTTGIGVGTALAKKAEKNRLVLINATITEISGTILTARTKSGKDYQIETENSKFLRRNAGKADFSEISAGDKISVWGTENSRNIIAKKIKDLSVERVSLEGTIIDIDEDENEISFDASKIGLQTVEVGDNTKITFRKVRRSNYPNLKARVFGIRSKTQNIIYNTTKIIVYSE